MNGNDRYVEVWNVVFSQYDCDPSIDRKDYKELPQKNIDTGMGLERLVALVQDGETNFDTDLFLPIIRATEAMAKHPYEGEYKMAYRVIADHVRTVTFALSMELTSQIVVVVMYFVVYFVVRFVMV